MKRKKEVASVSNLNSKEFGKNIRTRRKALGMTQAKLAELLDVSPNHISSIETGKSEASIKIIILLCDILKVTPDYLFLGNMHSNDISTDLVDIIKCCSEEDQKILYKIAKIYAEKNLSGKNR